MSLVKKLNLQKLWHDPVFSNVVAGLITTSIVAVAALNWAPVFLQMKDGIWKTLSETYPVPNWLIAMALLITFSFGLTKLKKFSKKNPKAQDKDTETSQDHLVIPPSHILTIEPVHKFTGTKFINLPSLQIQPAQQIWLNYVYQAFLKGEIIPPHVMSIELAESLPANFDYRQIDSRLLNSNENTITLLGIYFTHHSTDIIEKLDVIIKYIKQLITNNPRIDLIYAPELAKQLRLSEREVSTAFLLGEGCKGFKLTKGYGTRKDGEHYLNRLVTIQVGWGESFKFYKDYTDIETALKITLLA